MQRRQASIVLPSLPDCVVFQRVYRRSHNFALLYLQVQSQAEYCMPAVCRGLCANGVKPTRSRTSLVILFGLVLTCRCI